MDPSRRTLERISGGPVLIHVCLEYINLGNGQFDILPTYNGLLSDQERIKVKRALRGVRVEVHRKDYMRRYKVQAVTVEPTSQLK
ncbi:PAZ domain-containing protein [Tanacetum coccineum]|uniref:PAZ domain-containing protein n=1 Tax=Tanacetum coccineum TaxID=301880 RepID=A0ABQ5IUU6_9ASTR